MVPKNNANQVRFAVKFDKAEGIQGKELLQIRTQIAKVLQVNVAAFVICSVDFGCAAANLSDIQFCVSRDISTFL